MDTGLRSESCAHVSGFFSKLPNGHFNGNIQENTACPADSAIPQPVEYQFQKNQKRFRTLTEL